MRTADRIRSILLALLLAGGIMPSIVKAQKSSGARERAGASHVRLADRLQARPRVRVKTATQARRRAVSREEEETFWVWIPPSRSGLPTFREAYWSDPRVFPLIQAHVDLPDRAWWNAPGSRGYGGDTNYEDTESWAGKNPEAAADQMVGWTLWYRQQLRALGRREFRYALWLNGFGAPPHGGEDFFHNRRNVWTLGRNPADAIDAPISDRARVGSLYSEQGRALNAEWSRRFCERFDRRARRSRLGPPAALHFDMEGVFDLASIDEWWDPALRDERAGSEIVDGQRTMRQLARLAPNFDPAAGTYARRNKPFLMWIMGVASRATEYVLWEGFWKQAREIWPDVQLSNYQLTPASDRHPFPFEYVGSEISNVRLRYVTHAAPVLYPLNDWAFENGRVSVADQLARFGKRARGNTRRDLNQLNFLIAKARLDACLDNGMSVVAWVRPPDRDRLNMAQTVRLIRYGRRRGVRQWILWSEDTYDWSELLRRVGESQVARR